MRHAPALALILFGATGFRNRLVAELLQTASRRR